MCQLLGMSANTPTDIVFSFEGFRKRGGLTDHHEDGFGIAFFEADNALAASKPSGGVRLFHDDQPSATSPVGDLLRHYPIKSLNVIAHIRRATQGQNTLANTHPFVRELWGEYWVFAHNGQLTDFTPLTSSASAQYQPVGTTDSEAAFCYLLNALKSRFADKPSNDVLFSTLTELSRALGEYGMFNCLICNGDFQFCFATSLLHFITRKAPFGVAQRIDDEQVIDFSSVAKPNDVVTVIATTPLTDNEHWQQLAIGEAVAFSHGLIIFQDKPSGACTMSIAEGVALAQAIGACD